MYVKQDWSNYDDNKTLEENVTQGAVATEARLDHMEDGIEAANNTPMEILINQSERNFTTITETDGKKLVVVETSNMQEAFNIGTVEIGDELKLYMTEVNDKMLLNLKIPASTGGMPGKDGTDGKSAFDIAVDNGYTGTEVEWVASLNGEDGVDGLDGAAGPKGDKGDAGTNGIDGAVGPKGDKGDVGATGPKGDKGEAGTNGIDGVAGPKGDKGDAGTKGEDGVDGLDGTAGPKGDKGDKGDPLAIVKTFSSITEMNAYFSNPEITEGQLVIITTVDPIDEDNGKIFIKGTTQFDFYLKFNVVSVEGPKGDKGEDGVDGLDGAVGPKGDKGDVGATGPKGDKGEAGTNGIDGAAGPKGDKGEDGLDGAIGPKGDKGEDGAVGPKGEDGVDGLDGPKGDKGDVGAAGPKGDKGDAGTNGADGAIGPKGDKGDKGDKGEPGAAGIQGPQGIPGTGEGTPFNLKIGNITSAATPGAVLRVEGDITYLDIAFPLMPVVTYQDIMLIVADWVPDGTGKFTQEIAVETLTATNTVDVLDGPDMTTEMISEMTICNIKPIKQKEGILVFTADALAELDIQLHLRITTDPVS